MVSRELEKECVVVFDEAHNIDNVCIEARLGPENHPIVCCISPLMYLSNPAGRAHPLPCSGSGSLYMQRGHAQTGTCWMACNFLKPW